jgi:hypothetical protein
MGSAIHALTDVGVGNRERRAEGRGQRKPASLDTPETGTQGGGGPEHISKSSRSHTAESAIYHDIGSGHVSTQWGG